MKSRRQAKRNKGGGTLTSLLGLPYWEEKIEQHTSYRTGYIKFINKPLSNYDLIEWIDKLGIEHFRGVFSRNNLPKRIESKECEIAWIVTHWVSNRHFNGVVEYFDSFSLLIPSPIQKYLSTSGKNSLFDRWDARTWLRSMAICLYYLNDRQKCRSGNIRNNTLCTVWFQQSKRKSFLHHILFQKYITLLYMKIYCVKKKQTESVPDSERHERAKNGRLMVKQHVFHVAPRRPGLWIILTLTLTLKGREVLGEEMLLLGKTAWDMGGLELHTP